MGLSYRGRQFFWALKANPSVSELSEVRRILTPALTELFLRLQASEQVHSIQVMKKLQQEDHIHPDLLAAALLHDTGKCLHPLRIWERVLIVLARDFFPGWVSRWGSGEPLGWKRAFVVAEQHAAWGAELAALAGANPTTIQLIRRHQDTRPADARSFGDRCLIQLQLADDES